MSSLRGSWGLLLLGLAGCQSESFVCLDDQQCTLDGRAGQCHTGYCSFPDPECDSGLRYSEHAGALSGQCVVLEGTTSGEEPSGDDASMTTGSLSLDGPSGVDGGSSSDDGGEPSSGGEASSGGECTGGTWCGGACIDPTTDPFFCGASGSCRGADAGQACSPSAACTGGACVESCVNCGFEAGDFTGWTTVDLSDPYLALAVVMEATAEDGDFFTATPTEGDFTAVTGFDGNGPGTIELGQDITLAAAPPADLVFDYRAGWDLMTYGAMEDRTLEVQIEPEGGGDPREVVDVLTAPTGDLTDDTGVLTGEVDLSAYAGQTVFLRFVFTVPEDYSGPALAQIDDVRIVPQ